MNDEVREIVKRRIEKERCGMIEVEFIDKLDESSLNGKVGKQPEMNRDRTRTISSVYF